MLILAVTYLALLSLSVYLWLKGGLGGKCLAAMIFFVTSLPTAWALMQSLVFDGRSLSASIDALFVLVPLGLALTAPLAGVLTFSLWSALALSPLRSDPGARVPRSQVMFGVISLLLAAACLWTVAKFGAWPRLKPNWSIHF